jgi:acetyl-CoA C-acetyltransferase
MDASTMPNAVIVETSRTPIGRAFKGSLTGMRSDDLGGFAVRALLAKVPGLDPAEIEDLICGTACEAGEQAMNLGRLIGALAGLPETVAGTTVNRFCASSLQAIRMAHHAIAAGEGNTFIAAGVECVSRVSGRDFEESDMNPRFTDPARTDYVNDMYISMGLTAENVADRWGISRERMDEYAALSQSRALDAQASGFFAAEISPVPLPDGTLVERDDCPRPGSTVERLADLKPAFRENGRVTAGNSCPLNDGAAAVLVMSESRARELGLTPKARILASAVSGLAPEIMGVGPIEAVGRVLERASMTISDVDVVELNEAFAAQVLAVCDELQISIEDQLNPHGGAIALGHPFGMTGARIMTTLIHDLQVRDATIGLETMCIGGGQGMAMLIERMA